MLNRRQLIVAAARSSVLLSGAFALAACSETDSAAVALPAAEPDSLDEYTRQMQAISYVGVVCLEKIGYREDQPTEAIKADLEQRLLADLADPAGQATISDTVDRAIRNDFSAGRIVEVDGWQLSETECRLAALAAAQQGFETAQVPEGPKERYAEFVEVEAWGPQATVQGQAFNEQPDGHSGIWVKAAGAPASVVLQFDGKTQGTQVYAGHLTSGLRGEYIHEVIDTPGVYRVELYDKATLTRQVLGDFTVNASGDQSQKVSEDQLAACKINSWGPNKGKAGEAFNRQPSGASAFWVRTNCAANGSQMLLDGAALKTTVHKDLLTAKVPNGHRLEAGSHELDLRVGNGPQVLKVGTLVIEPR
jgi:hypothetical protein